jgi:ubiquinone/menaquinone biosynthesis C-methylase UbiE
MSRSCYDQIAKEYYDAQHVTSRNFDNATRSALKETPFPVPGGRILEIGAGRGRVGEFLGVDPSSAVQLDNSEVMFDLKDREDCMLKILADARDIPLVSKQFSTIVGFLIDAFMGFDCLAEAHRMLVPDGQILLTVPTQQWGTTLRSLLHIDVMTTRFKVIGTENAVLLPSILHSPAQIHEMLEIVGFNEIKVLDHTLPADEQSISPDITSVCDTLNLQVSELPIIHSVRAKR